MNDPGTDSDDAAQDAAGARRRTLVAILVVLALVAGGIWFSRALRHAGQVQDCVMAGRSNCAPVER